MDDFHKRGGSEEYIENLNLKSTAVFMKNDALGIKFDSCCV